MDVKSNHYTQCSTEEMFHLDKRSTTILSKNDKKASNTNLPKKPGNKPGKHTDLTQGQYKINKGKTRI